MFRRLLTILCALALSSLAHAQPLTTAFTYQGSLSVSGAPTTGVYDMRFRLYDAAAAGSQVGATLCSDNLAVANGAFTVQLDFGSQFAGQQRFLEIDVRQDSGLPCSNAAGFTTLTPRQPLSAAPNSLYSLNAASAATAANATNAVNATNATNAATATNSTQLNSQPAAFYQNAANLTGTLPSARLSGTYSSQLNLSSASNTFTGAFSGSGAGLTGVPWNAITGAPSTVLLQSSPPSTAQTGSSWLAGSGQFDGGLRVGINYFADYPLAINGGAQVKFDHTDGDALHIGTSIVPFALSLESTEQILNLDMNFRAVGNHTQYRGAAIRLDSRSAAPPIQFITRPTNSAVETTALSISELGTVFIGPSTQNQSYLEVSDGSVSRFSTATFESSAVTSRAIMADSLGQYAITAFGDGTSSTAMLAYVGATSGNTIGLQAETWSPSGTAIMALAQQNSGTTYALHAVGYSPAGNAGWFEGPGPDTVYINNTGNGRGLHVTSASDTAVWGVTTTGFAGVDGRTGLSTGRGVTGSATASSGVNFGVTGSTSSPGGFGVYSFGNFGASGTKAFRIDHPADPAHKYLFHYSTESPEVLNFYSGKVTLNQQGEATVDLPAYFARINKDPRYLLTPIGAPMPLLHVATEISDQALEDGAKAEPDAPVPTCSFTIAGGAPNAKVSWRVEAVRNDRWLQANGAPVEVSKEGPDDGTYQQPALYPQK